MPTWNELRAEFEATREALRHSRLDYQWGAAGIHYRLAGGPSSPATRRFEILASIAGSKLADLPEGTVVSSVFQAESPKAMWYEALRYHSGSFELGFVGQQTDESGNHQGNIYTGTQYLPAEASALLALQYSAVPEDPASNAHPPTILARVNVFLRNEAEQRGYLWLFVGFVVTVVIGALAL